MAIEATHKEIKFGVGDVVRVHQLIANKSEEEKGSRTQAFEGTVIGIKGHGVGKSFTVRRIGEQNVGIEMIFPLASPVIDKVEVVREGKSGVRQSKLYYIRKKSTREIEAIYTRSKRKGQVQKPKAKAKKVVKKKAAKKAAKKSTKKAK